MITRHAVGHREDTGNYYVIQKDNPTQVFGGFDDEYKPVYENHGKPYETKEQAAMQAQMLNDQSCALNQTGGV